jgi:uncharacterized protein YjbI with pentapeptide repeats
MANAERLALLKKSVADWNKYRKNDSKVIPDLHRADLTLTKLGEANLVGADLFRAELIAADLMGADLMGADLMGADLTGRTLLGEPRSRKSDKGAPFRSKSLLDRARRCEVVARATRIRDVLQADFRKATKGKAFESQLPKLLDALGYSNSAKA